MFKTEKTKSIFTTLAVFGGIILMSGCVNRYPIPVQEPSAGGEDSNGNFIRATPDYKRGGLVPPTNIKEARDDMKIYGDAYQSYADDLRRGNYITDDLGLLGAVTGVVGGLTNSVNTVVAGAVLGTGAPMISERYNVLIQANNYDHASSAMYCMYSKIYSNRHGNHIDHLDAKEWIDEIRRKLRKAQSEVNLVKVSFDDLRDSIKATYDAAKELKKQEKAVNEKEGNVKIAKEDDSQNKDATLTKAKKDLNAEQEKQRQIELKALNLKLKECVASFGVNS